MKLIPMQVRVRKDFKSSVGIFDSILMTGLSDAAHFGLKDGSKPHNSISEFLIS